MARIFKFILAFVISLNLLLTPAAFAQEEKVDVYALFWPVVPGTTVADSTFFLKQLKESIGGVFKSGNINQSKYQMELSEKRLVEANKLVESKDYSNAKKSLRLNKSFRDEAIELKRKALENNEKIDELASALVKSLEKQQQALNFMATQFPQDQQAELQKIVGDLSAQISAAK